MSGVYLTGVLPSNIKPPPPLTVHPLLKAVQIWLFIFFFFIFFIFF